MTMIAVGLGLVGAVPAGAAILDGGVVRAPAAAVGDRAAVPQPSAGGWEVRGRVAPLAVADGLRLTANTTLVSPPVAVPAGAQTLTLRVAAPGAGALVRVAALVEGEAGERELGVREPAVRPGEIAVGVGALAGRTIRLVVDPAPALGASLVLGQVGPFRAPLPGWTIPEGAPEAVGRGAAARLRVRDEAARLVGPPAPPLPARAVALLVRVRGEGRVSGRAGGQPATLVAGPHWRDLVVPVPARGPRTLALSVVPAGRGVELRELGAVRVRVAAVGTRIRGTGAARRVVGRTVPAAPGAMVRALSAAARPLGSATVDRAGRFSITVGRGPRSTRVIVVGDRLRLGGPAPVR